MKPAPLPDNEQERLALLRELDVLDTLEEQPYDDLTRIAASICGTPIALVSLVDEKREWFKSHHGLDATETPREFAFCAHAILSDELFYIPDSEADERFADNPLVTDAPHVKFYAGMPLTVRDDLRVGTLCVIDNEPRSLTDEQLDTLTALGRQVVSQLELRLKIKELEALDQMKTEFVAMVSHELRTPLTSIHGSLSLLNSGIYRDKPEKTELLVRTSLSNSSRLIGIVNDILDLTKLESGSFEITCQPGDINETIRAAATGLTAYCDKCSVSLALDLADALPTITYDDQRIIQVLSNLVSNAAKFSPEGSTVTIISTASKGGAQVEVRDEGQGIPKDSQGQVFAKFSKIGISTTKTIPGTGIGLSICKQLVELHKGKIWFKSSEGVGTSFYFLLSGDNDET